MRSVLVTWTPSLGSLDLDPRPSENGRSGASADTLDRVDGSLYISIYDPYPVASASGTHRRVYTYDQMRNGAIAFQAKSPDAVEPVGSR